MKRLFPVISVFCLINVISVQLNAQVNSKVHKICLQAADYKGCIEAQSSKTDKPVKTGKINDLRNALMLLPERLRNTSLRDFGYNTQIFYDSLSLVTEEDKRTSFDKDIVAESFAIKAMIDALQRYWSDRIYSGTSYGSSGTKSYKCEVLLPRLRSFNDVAGYKYSVRAASDTKSMFTLLGPYRYEVCYPQESSMINAIIQRINNALVDPKVRAAELEKQKRDEELARLDPWERHLEKNPALKKWAEANPTAAAKEREKFLKK